MQPNDRGGPEEPVTSDASYESGGGRDGQTSDVEYGGELQFPKAEVQFERQPLVWMKLSFKIAGATGNGDFRVTEGLAFLIIAILALMGAGGFWLLDATLGIVLGAAVIVLLVVHSATRR